MADDLLDFLFDDDENLLEENEQQPEDKEDKQPQQINVSGGLGPSIPTQDTAYIEHDRIAIPGQQPLNVQFNIPAKPTLQHEVEMWDVINNFETNSWSPSNVGIKSGWASVDAAFDGGIKPGFIIVGGDSNIG